MERKKANGALPRAPSPKPLFPQPQPPPPPPSVPSFSSLSDPSFLKDFQAAFKRHRPLGTMSSSNLLRARRVPVQQVPGKVGEPEESSLTPPSISGTITASAEPEGKAGGVASGSSGANALSHAADRIAASGEKLAALKELQHNPGTEGLSTSGRKQANMADMNSLKVGHLEKVPQYQHSVQSVDPMTQCLTAGSLCATTMSIHSGPTVQSIHGASAMQSVPIAMTVPGSESSGMAQGHSGMNVAARSYEVPGHPQEFCGNGVIGRKQADAVGHGSQAQVPSTKSSCNADVERHVKSEKVRKKKYDLDLFFKVNGNRYQRLGKIGSGGSSEVYKVISSDCMIYALKRIKLKGRDYPTAFGFCQEIEYLNKLHGKNNIIELVDYEVTDDTLMEEVQRGTLANKDGKIKDDSFIYMVLEYGEIDLAHMLSQKWKDSKNTKVDENWLRFYWQQMLEAVHTIHEERIVHSDLKPANFLLVKGSLKLIDFGIAKAIMSDTTNIQRDAQVGTLNYMSPEAFMWNEEDGNGSAIKCGRPSDIWSLGCILYQMVYGKTPFADYKTFWAKFKVITDRNHKIEYGPISNPWLIDLMKKCLAWDRDERWRIPHLLQHPFLNPPMPPLDTE